MISEMISEHAKPKITIISLKFTLHHYTIVRILKIATVSILKIANVFIIFMFQLSLFYYISNCLEDVNNNCTK